MFTYFIAGVPNRPDFGHAKFIAEKLKRSLPRFSYEIIVKTEEEYKNWLSEFCQRQKWNINKNPIVWKRATTTSDDNCRLIGGISEFFELLSEYYNIDTRLDKQFKKMITLDNKERMSLMSIDDRTRCLPTIATRNVCITGAVYPSTSYLVSELMQLNQLHAEDGVTIRLHHSDVNKYEDLIKIRNKMANDRVFEVHGYSTVVVVNSIEEGLSDCDLLVVFGDVKRDQNEDRHGWMERNHDAMAYLASLLNRHCPRQCKVLLTGMDLLCFNLSVLAEYAHQIYLYNIVGVTGHLGMETLPTISRTTAIPVSHLRCPPVWGFVGSAKYIDVDRVVYTRRRSDGDNDDETTAGDKYLRTVLLQSAGDLPELVNGETTDNSTKIDCCPLSYLPEVRATVRLLTEWFKHQSSTTICAAVFSDGTFGLPFGMFMSQPVYMEKGEWKPNYDYPSPNEKILNEIVSKVTDIMTKYNLGNRFKMYKKSSLQISK